MELTTNGEISIEVLKAENKALQEKLAALEGELRVQNTGHQADASALDYDLAESLDLLPASVLLINLNREIELVNTTFEIVSGFSQEEIQGQHINSIISQSNPEIVLTDLWKHLEEEKIWKGELINLTKEGDKINERAIVSPYRDRNSKLRGYLFFQDVVTSVLEETKDAVYKHKIYEAVYNDIGDGILLGDPRGNILHFNVFFERLTNLKVENVLGRHISELFPKDVMEEKPFDFRALDAGKSIIIEREILQADGSRLMVEMHSKKLTDLGYIASFRDLTERENARKEIARSEERYRMLSDLSTEGILIHHLGIASDVNEAIVRMFGYSREELIGKDVIPMFFPEEETQVLVMQHVRHKDTEPYEVMGRKKDGEYMILELEGRSISDSDNNLRVTSVRDISFRKKIERVYSVSLELQSLIGTEKHDTILQWIINQSLSLVDSDAGFVYYPEQIDAMVSEVFWYEKGKALRSSESEKELEHIREICQGVCFDKKGCRENDVPSDTFFECTVYTKQVKRYMLVPYIENDEVKMVFGVVNKQVDYNTLDKNVLAILGESLWSSMDRYLLQNNLRQANAAKDKFFSIIAHDLKAPISSMATMADLLAQNIESYDLPTLANYMGILASTGSSTYTLLENLLQWARSQANKIDFKPDHIKFHDVLMPCVDILNQSMDQKKQKLDMQIDDNVVLYADKNLITTVLRNLLSNAIKFTPKEGHIAVRAQQVNGHCQVCVEDKGIGMEAADLEKVFDISQEFSKLGTEKEKGSGIGLLLCQEFVRLNDGKMWAESVLGEGSSFYFTVPVQQK